MALTEKELERAIDRIMSNFDDVNTFFIQKVAKQIKKIGELGQASVNQLIIMSEMGSDITEITQRLQLATNLSVKQLFKVYQTVLTDAYTDPRFARAVQQHPIPQNTKDRITQYAQAVSVQSANTIRNLSNTTVVSQTYREAVDKAVLAVSSGMTDYQTATREIVRQLGASGMQVHYDSGYHRRLDTAVRQNIIDATNQIAQHSSIMMGEELGYDALEISAHLRSAPDHEPVQGRVFLKAEFEKMQAGQPFQDVDGNHYAGFRRPIGEWNCMHIAMAFSTQYSVRRYTDKQLREWAQANADGCEIDGKHYTVYQASQLMRELETAIRREKDVAVAAKAAGNKLLRQACQRKINALSRQYGAVAAAANLPTHRERTMVEGFRAVKVNNQGP